MPLERESFISLSDISLEDIRKYYFEKTRQTLRIEDAKYLYERAQELEIRNNNGGVQALFKSLKYNLGDSF